MIFSQKLRLYKEIQGKYGNNNNYLFIMQYLTLLLDTDDEQSTNKTYQVLRQEASTYAVQIAGKNLEFESMIKKDVEYQAIKKEVEGEDFEW